MDDSKFEIRRGYPGDLISRKISVAAPRGKAYGGGGADGSDVTTAALAGANNFLGFVTRPVVDGGPTLADHVYPGRLELPFTTGHECTLEKADEIECEGADYMVLSGTGALSAASAVGTKCSFNSGRLREAQTGETVFFAVSANQLTPVDEGGTRLRFERV